VFAALPQYSKEICKDLLSNQKDCVDKEDSAGHVPLEVLCRSSYLTKDSIDICEQVRSRQKLLDALIRL